MQLRAILTCVDYADLLSLSLPYNRHHFSEVYVVTTPEDTETIEVASRNGATPIPTELFHESGRGDFNKWRALEYGLDVIGRTGWIALLDADIFWPRRLPKPPWGVPHLEIGHLVTPYRRMAPLTPLVPSEQIWANYPRHRNIGEWAGYTQIFNAADPVLGKPPWHETNWKHAGGADSFFQRKWNPRNKIRPPWEVLHMGPSGTNWLGRASEYLDGSKPEDSLEKQSRLVSLLSFRRHGNPDPYSNEKYTPPDSP